MNERLPIRIETALNEYRNEKVSFGKASEIAGVNLWRFIDICHQNNVPMKFSKEDAQIGIDFVKKFDFDEYKTQMEKKKMLVKNQSCYEIQIL